MMTISWYESEIGDSNKTVLQINCNGVPHKLVLKKNEIVAKENDIVKWFDKIKAKCEGVVK